MRPLLACVLAALLTAASSFADYDLERQVALSTYGDVCDVGTLAVPITIRDLGYVTDAEGHRVKDAQGREYRYAAFAHWTGAQPPFTGCSIELDDEAITPEMRCRVLAGHEFGHLAGLPHSSDPASIMSPGTLGFWQPCAFLAATAARRYPAGCLTQDLVNVGYYPYRVAHATVLRVAASDTAIVRHVLPVGRRFAVQSVPNPRHLSDPGMPPATGGFVWGYAKRGGRSGWVRADALTIDDPADPWAEGPAGIDFQAPDGQPDDSRAPRFVLGHVAGGQAVVTAVTVYQRWAARGSPMALLLRGRRVGLLWRASGHYCADVDGRRGWIAVRALRLAS